MGFTQKTKFATCISFGPQRQSANLIDLLMNVSV